MNFCAIAAAFIAASSSAASASTITEITDAGRSMATAFDVTDGTTAVSGSLINTSISDVDLYSFRLREATRLTVRVLSTAFDANLLWFNDRGQGLAGDDDIESSCDNYTNLTVGDSCLSLDLLAGTYFVGVGDNNTGAFETAADAATGRNEIFDNDDGILADPTIRILSFIGDENGDVHLNDEGDYLLDFSTAVYAASDPSVVPLPAGLPLLLAGLGSLGVVRRFKARVSFNPTIHTSQDWKAA
ncbi:VPLPA-CTERM sorting domain-containing protein [uncultured Roseobacter sp.]|uniref:VPLPA-CTERM sorting domain-containing protein n=1 Tax=uncultured Roseobacter sp. TaxID=114847 RepID=UPI00262A74A3|nr:VPLPA-CTERM sorting domain-containing protein [uncultured Roseobacter sp.]